jgi:hypothetical protein
MADITGNGNLDPVAVGPAGDLVAYESGLRFVVCTELGDPGRVALADVAGEGYPDLVVLRGDGVLLVYPHSGVFWPQDPLTTYLAPVVVAEGWSVLDLIG